MNDFFFGIYRAIVIDNNDPMRRMRLRVRIPSIFGEDDSGWANACVPSAATPLPDIGNVVWIQFESGDPSFPVWTGIFIDETAMDEEATGDYEW